MLNINGINLLPQNFLSAESFLTKLFRIHNNKNFSIIGEFVEDSSMSLKNNGDIYCYELIEETNTFRIKTSVGNTTIKSNEFIETNLIE